MEPLVLYFAQANQGTFSYTINDEDRTLFLTGPYDHHNDNMVFIEYGKFVYFATLKRAPGAALDIDDRVYIKGMPDELKDLKHCLRPWFV